MATAQADALAGRISVPPQQTNERDGTGEVSAESIARDVAEFHRKGLRRRRYRDLTAEKYLIHIDGEGDAQWADIWNGQRVVIPANLSGASRAQHNLLRPIVDNAVAYHTTMPFRFAVPTAISQAAREQSLVDQVLANYLVQEQRWNALFAEALYLAAAYGHCPVHAYWRDDVGEALFEPVEYNREQQEGLQMPQGGMIDTWVGDPWDSVYHQGATANSVQSWTYGRVLPAELVRRAFSHVQGIETVEGNDRLPSASRFQRVARKWLHGSRDVHGTATIYGGEPGAEMLALICRETAPGITPDAPAGKLEVIALKGSATTDEGESIIGSNFGEAALLHVGPLPGGTFSAVRVYSGARYDDVLGKPFVADLDDLQVQRNQLEALETEYIRRSVRAPLVTPMGVDQDTLFWEDNTELEIDPTTTQNPYFLELPYRHLVNLEKKIIRIEQTMFRIGGWQAASRGEGSAGDSGKKVLALARADDTVHGPVNQRFRESVEALMGVCWRLMKEYGDVPIVVDAVGEEAGYLAEPYIDRTRLSDKPPHFILVSGFGATPETKAQQLLQLVTTVGMDGEPLMETREFRAAWPDASTYPTRNDPQELRLRRPKVVNEQIRKIAQGAIQQMPQLAQIPLGHPLLEQFALQLNMQLDLIYPILMDDDVPAFIETLSMLTQDETEVPLVRALAKAHQGLYYRWLAIQQAQAAEAAMLAAGPEGTPTRAQPGPNAAAAAGTQTSTALARAGAEEPMSGGA